MRLGSTEAPYVELQRQKSHLSAHQLELGGSLLEFLPPLVPGLVGHVTLDVVVVGAGPAGLRLAAQLGQRGLKVGVVGADEPFTNNYGVWMDEFRATGLIDAVDQTWPACDCFYGEGKKGRVAIKRAYGRLDRRKFRDLRAQDCKTRG